MGRGKYFFFSNKDTDVAPSYEHGCYIPHFHHRAWVFRPFNQLHADVFDTFGVEAAGFYLCEGGF